MSGYITSYCWVEWHAGLSADGKNKKKKKLLSVWGWGPHVWCLSEGVIHKVNERGRGAESRREVECRQYGVITEQQVGLGDEESLYIWTVPVVSQIIQILFLVPVYSGTVTAINTYPWTEKYRLRWRMPTECRAYLVSILGPTLRDVLRVCLRSHDVIFLEYVWSQVGVLCVRTMPTERSTYQAKSYYNPSCGGTWMFVPNVNPSR